MHRRATLIILSLSTLLLGLSAPTPPLQAGPKQLAIVVGKSSPIKELSFHQLKQLYLGERLTGPNGKWLIPLNRPSSASERIAFDREVLKMRPDVAKSYWIDRKIRGQSGPPKSINSAALILRLVSKVPNAIGYVEADEAKGANIVKIDGKLPGEKGYPLSL